MNLERLIWFVFTQSYVFTNEINTQNLFKHSLKIETQNLFNELIKLYN